MLSEHLHRTVDGREVIVRCGATALCVCVSLEHGGGAHGDAQRVRRPHLVT